MNRAILIVICDFLVSAMLSMMTGMVPAHTGGTGVGLDEETTRVLLSELEANRAALEQMRARLREAVRRAGSATPEQERELSELARRIISLRREAELLRERRDPEHLAVLTAEQLQRRLELELRERMRAEMELQEQRSDLAETGRELRELRRDFAETGRAVSELTRRGAETQKELAESQRKLMRSEQDLAAARSRLQSAGAELEAGRRELERRAADLAGVQETLREMNARLGRSTTEAGNLRQTLAYTTGKLDSAEREAAEVSGRLARLQKQYSVTVLERDEARRKQEELARMVKNTVRELSQARKSAEESRVKSAEAAGRLTAVTAELKEAKRKLGNHVLQCYGSGAVKLEVAVREARLMIEQRGGGVYYLPLIELGGRKLIVGHFNQFAGDMERPLVFNRVLQAAMFMSVPGVERTQGVPLTGPVMLSPRELRAAAVAAPEVSERTPLKALTLEELRARGVQDLYLFKAGGFGRDNAELDGRCSLDVSDGVPYLFVRNSGSRSELPAAPGDFVLSREGDFVGLVVDTVSRGFGRGEEARVFVFPDAGVWDNPRIIPFDKPNRAGYCDAFAAAVRAVKTALKQ